MLDFMRRTTGSIVMYFLLGGIIFVFAVTFGPGGGAGGGCSTTDPNYAAIVDGESIRQEEFALLYGQRVDQMRKMYNRGGGQLSDELLKQLGLRKQVIDGLIDARLMAQEASRRGLVVSDEELLAYLSKNYGVNDDVSGEQYEGWVNSVFRMPVWRFEERVRGEILASKMSDVVTEVLSVSDAEVHDNYLKESDRAKVTYVRFDPTVDSNKAPTDSAIADLIANDMKAVEDRFGRDISKYRKPKQVKASQILRRLSPKATEEEVASARKLLEGLKAKVDGGADFAALAKEHSQDKATADKGGVMGVFARGQMLKALDEVAWGLEAGAVGAVVKTRLGLHLVRADGFIEPSERALEDVKNEVAAAVLTERAADANAKAAADAFAAEVAGKAGEGESSLTVLESLTLASAPKDKEAAANKPVRATSPWVTKADTSIPAIGTSVELMDAVFKLEQNAVAEQAYQVGRSYYVVGIEAREVPSDADFAEKKESLRDQALSTKRSRVVRDWLKHLRDKADIQLNPAVFGADGA